MVSSVSRSFAIFFLNKYGFSAFFLPIFVGKLSVLKSVESNSVLEKCPASAGIYIFLSHILKVRTYNLFYFISIFSI